MTTRPAPSRLATALHTRRFLLRRAGMRLVQASIAVLTCFVMPRTAAAQVPKWQVLARVEKQPIAAGECSWVSIDVRLPSGKLIPLPDGSGYVGQPQFALTLQGAAASQFKWQRNTPGSAYLCAVTTDNVEGQILVSYPRPDTDPKQVKSNVAFEGLLRVRAGGDGDGVTAPWDTLLLAPPGGARDAGASVAAGTSQAASSTPLATAAASGAKPPIVGRAGATAPAAPPSIVTPAAGQGPTNIGTGVGQQRDSIGGVAGGDLAGAASAGGVAAKSTAPASVGTERNTVTMGPVKPTGPPGEDLRLNDARISPAMISVVFGNEGIVSKLKRVEIWYADAVRQDSVKYAEVNAAQEGALIYLKVPVDYSGSAACRQGTDCRVRVAVNFVGVYENGSIGRYTIELFQSDLLLQPRNPPPAVEARQVANDAVQLTWGEIAGVPLNYVQPDVFLVSGPGLPPEGLGVPGNRHTITIPGLLPGNYTWSVISLWYPGPVFTSLNAARATITVTSPFVPPPGPPPPPDLTRGRYLVSLTGFKAYRQTYDDPLNRDGWGDEIYAAARVSLVGRADDAVRETGIVKSKVHGSPGGWVDRVAIPNGIVSGTKEPQMLDAYLADPTNTAVASAEFPMKLWQGELRDGGDVLLIAPTLWEWDDDATQYSWWAGALAAALPGGVKAYLAGPVTVQTPVWTTSVVYRGDWSYGCAFARSRDGFDRTIGSEAKASNGALVDFYCQRYIVLSKELIERELNRTTGNSPAGVIELRFVEPNKIGDSTLNGDYSLFVKIVRLP